MRIKCFENFLQENFDQMRPHPLSMDEYMWKRSPAHPLCQTYLGGYVVRNLGGVIDMMNIAVTIPWIIYQISVS